MTEILLGVVVVCLLAVIGLQVALLLRKVGVDLSPLQHTLQGIDKSYERVEGAVREEIAKNRSEASAAGRQSREELSNSLKAVADTLAKRFDALTQATSATLKGVSESLVNNIGEMAKLQKGQLDVFSERLDKLTQSNEQKLDKMRETIEQRLGVLQEDNAKKLAEMRQDAAASSQKTRDEVTIALKAFNESVGKTINDFLDWQRRQFGGVIEQLKGLTDANEKRLVEVRTTVEERLKTIQADNAKNLEQMRQTVDEKLQGTLEKRLGESFKLVSERLEQVYKGLGEMQTLAVGVGDLKRVLTNVKSRGTWGEVQLEAMLEQVLCPDQYDKNVATKDDAERVEFAIKLPGRGEDRDDIVWLPIDAKFPIEDYQRLQDAQEKGDGELAETCGKHLENRIKLCAGDISDKYLNPPKTTDFGILFLPTEGLFAEVVRRPGLPELIQREYKVVIAGPTTLWSILNSLQMGFRTLAIQQRSSEVWNLLAAVKTEFGRYGDVLTKVQKKLQEATNTIDTAAVRTRAIERKLRGVQELPAQDAQSVLMLEQVDGDGETAQ
jgi:DNA recombination protein RmuC